MQPNGGEVTPHCLLAETAELLGIEQTYWDIWGIQHTAPPEVLRTILKSLDVDATSDESLQRAMEQREREEWSTLLPPAIVVGTDAPRIIVSVRAESAAGNAAVRIEQESGEIVESTIDLADCAMVAQRAVDGLHFMRKVLPVAALGRIPYGYHRITVTAGYDSASARLIVCPEKAYSPPGRAAGIAISLYGLRSNRNWGCGDFTDLTNLIDWVANDVGASFIALNPLHSIPNRTPYNTSPYLPDSIYYRNFIYLDIERIPEFPEIQCHSFRQDLAQLRQAPFVEYERVSRLKLRVLKVLFRRFLRNPASEFREYVERQGQLLNRYATYRALDEALHKANRDVWNWRSWPPEYQSPESPATVEFAKQHCRSILFYKWVQWQIDGQIAEVERHARERGLSIGLYHDLALATDRFGSDLWATGEFYVDGCRVGSPPDSFAPEGQDWAFPPPNARRHFEDGYRLFAESIRKSSAHGGALRIDHVMRFFRLYWIPDGMPASEGTYVRDRYEDLLRVLSLESVRHPFVVVGEDLGTVPDYVREMLARFGVLSYRLFFFEQDKTGRFRASEEYPSQAVVSASTHDLPTLAGFWEHGDIDARLEAGVLQPSAVPKTVQERMAQKQKMLDLLHAEGLLPGWFPTDVHRVPEFTGELHNAVTGFLCSTPCQLMVMNQEDLFKETAQQNLPGTTDTYPNWRHKMRYTIEELHEGLARPYTTMFRKWLGQTGRLNRFHSQPLQQT